MALPARVLHGASLCPPEDHLEDSKCAETTMTLMRRWPCILKCPFLISKVLFLAWLTEDLTQQGQSGQPSPLVVDTERGRMRRLAFAGSLGHQQGGQPRRASHLSSLLNSYGLEPGQQTEGSHWPENTSRWTHSPSHFLRVHGSWFSMETGRNLF